MNEFFGGIYSLFAGTYGMPLANFMYEDGRLYGQIGAASCAAALIVGVAFYYVVDHPALNSWRGWGMSVGVCALAGFLIGWGRVLAVYNSGGMVETDLTTGTQVPVNVSPPDIAGFGVAAAIVAAAIYAAACLALRTGSTNCSHYPHLKR